MVTTSFHIRELAREDKLPGDDLCGGLLDRARPT
jgi:hypothetical protein